MKPIDDDVFYLAPESLFGEKPDGRTDIFMIGVIGYELLTGRRPLGQRRCKARDRGIGSQSRQSTDVHSTLARRPHCACCGVWPPA